MNGKRMYDMDEAELTAFISIQEHTVAKLAYERPGSSLLNHESGILKDAKQLLDEMRDKKNKQSREPHF
ncbi:MAG: hypothetical protein WBC78_14940 [Candidatus Sulfotelmatobacter sp.]